MPDARAPRNSKPRGGSARKAAAAGRTSSGWQPTGHGKKSTDATLPTLNKATPSAGAPLFKPTNGKVYTESRAMFAQPSAAPLPREWGRKKSDVRRLLRVPAALGFV